MSFNFQSTLELLQSNDYVSLAIITTVIYDYLLNIPREMDYVWCRPWTWVSTMFVVVRYLGLSLAILLNLNGTTFVPGPEKASSSDVFRMLPFVIIFWQIISVKCGYGYSEGTTIYFVTSGGYIITLFVADWIMILRVYAMWNRSKIILGVFLLIYMTQIIISVVFGAIFLWNPDHVTVAVTQVFDFAICSVSNNLPPLLGLWLELPRFILGAALLVLAVIQTLKHLVNMYRATKLWQSNRYIQLLVRDGIIYFLVNVLLNVVELVSAGPTVSNSVDLVASFATTAIWIMMPRFIIGVRELYVRDLRGRFQGIDTGFGVFSQSIASQHAAISTIEFTDVIPHQGQSEEEAVDLEEIRLEPRVDRI